ncbi:MAG: hypothetical protein ACOC57_05385 [Acidobacteriota bacterium]
MPDNDIQWKLGEFQDDVERCFVYLKSQWFLTRLRSKSHDLWASQPIPELSNRLGWLELPQDSVSLIPRLEEFTENLGRDGIQQLVLLGMGGSSLAPEVIAKTFGLNDNSPRFCVCDTTHPGYISGLLKTLNLKKTFFLVSSKSGTTLETMALFHFFWKHAVADCNNPGKHFAAITDPGTPLERLAAEKNFREVFTAPPEVGGRFSALSVFGLLPASILRVETRKLLKLAEEEFQKTFSGEGEKTASLFLGAVLSEIGSKKDKLSFLTTPSLRSFPAWLEQLIAESLGKEGKGLVPVIDEPLIKPEDYSADRLFIFYSLKEEKSSEFDSLIKKIVRLGHPVICFNLTDKEYLSAEMFRWEVAVAVAGSLLEVHPFNQPDVALAKSFTKEMLESESKGKEGLVTYNAWEEGKIRKVMEGWLDSAKERDYISILAFLSPEAELYHSLQSLRKCFLEKSRLATTFGYGPRYLHSAGQLHKGGPNTGLFLQLVDEPEEKLLIPHSSYTFRDLINAQSRGDYLALKQRGRRVVRISLGKEPQKAVQQLIRMTEEL